MIAGNEATAGLIGVEPTPRPLRDYFKQVFKDIQLNSGVLAGARCHLEFPVDDQIADGLVGNIFDIFQHSCLPGFFDLARPTLGSGGHQLQHMLTNIVLKPVELLAVPWISVGQRCLKAGGDQRTTN
ncbi:hypothetical protein G6321_00045860 [Bradyrhizobium barranii subsp. barranii]|uniref:Uncharacterized protein n=1 Tax=Bradyrhizobium barranii subsp. barranii TaxID=2823807 RepID=A0A9X9YPM9_9BRAD|nr:hypothetical protein [Bradyrhizobium barranii]UGX92884.1 hypothetical protein G6321_00045860 [Bradyrhizobium barranii subsp. barranii]